MSRSLCVSLDYALVPEVQWAVKDLEVVHFLAKLVDGDLLEGDVFAGLFELQEADENVIQVEGKAFLLRQSQGRCITDFYLHGVPVQRKSLVLRHDEVARASRLILRAQPHLR